MLPIEISPIPQRRSKHSSLQRNERIRADEFQTVLASAGSECDLPAKALQGWHVAPESTFSPGPDTTTEAELPGYMDNIVAGCVGNCLDLRGTNHVVDSDLSSFGTAVRCASGILQADDADAVLIVGVNAVAAPELADVWSRQLGTSVRPFEASVFLVARRAADITDTHQIQPRSIGGAQRKNRVAPGGLRLVLGLDDSSDPAVHRAHVASALCSGQGHGPNLIHANSSSGNITTKE